MTHRRPKYQKERPPDPTAIAANWRLFLALPMPPAATALIRSISTSFAGYQWPVRWTVAESAHLTLHFIGETAPERAELLRLSLGATVARHRAFTLQTHELGCFPDSHHPRVLWLGLDGNTTALADLHGDLGRTLARLGIEVERQRFHPHITLGRVREGAPTNLGAEIQRAYNDPALIRLVNERTATIEVEELLLMRSVLERGGARHSPLASFPLARDRAG